MKLKPLSSRRSSSGNPPAGCLVPFSLIFVLVGAAIFWFLLLRPVAKMISSRSWPAVPCTVLESHVEEHSDSDGSTYRAVVFSSYSYGGQEYRTNRYNFSVGSSSGYEGKAEIVARYPPGTRTVCYVNPGNPSEAVLSREFALDYLFGLLGLFFLLPGLILLIWSLSGVRGSKRAPTAPAPTAAVPAAVSTAAVSTAADPESPFGVKNPQGDVSGPVELRPVATPLGKLAGMAFFTLVWNGIVGVIGWFGVLQEEEPEGCVIAFLSLFAFAGVIMILATLRQFLVLFNPRPKLTLSPGVLTTGGTAYLQWRLSGGIGGVRSLRILLEGREEARYRQGTSTSTDREVFATVPIVDTTDPYQMGSGSASLAVPHDTMPSFSAENNRIVWTIKAHVEIGGWPDSDEEFEILVRPLE